MLALDVIEHLDDDRAAVRRLGELVRPGGIVVVSVPALPELFTEFDAIQGHRRRYLPETLRAAFAGTGPGAGTGLLVGPWLVPTLRRQRARPRAEPGESPSEVYRRYLGLPPWPLAWPPGWPSRWSGRWRSEGGSGWAHPYSPSPAGRPARVEGELCSLPRNGGIPTCAVANE